MNISMNDLKFIKTYSKEKKSYESKEIAAINNFDCNARQAPKLIFNRINRKDFKYNKQRNRIKDFFGYGKNRGLNDWWIRAFYESIDELNYDTPDMKN